MTDLKYPDWMDLPLPEFVERVSKEEELIYLEKAARIVETRSSAVPLYPERQIYWPKDFLSTRAIRGTILPLDHEEGCEDDLKIDTFFAKTAPKGVVVWGINFKHEGFYRGNYTNEFREWIATQLIVSPVCIMVEGADIVLLIDQQNHFSVLGASLKHIALLDETFGGPDVLRQDFKEYVEDGSVGFDAEDNTWAKENVFPWCGWSYHDPEIVEINQ